jgi:hypothetical protein
MRPPDKTDGRQIQEFKIDRAHFRGRHVHGVSWKTGTPVWESILAKRTQSGALNAGMSVVSWCEGVRGTLGRSQPEAGRSWRREGSCLVRCRLGPIGFFPLSSCDLPALLPAGPWRLTCMEKGYVPANGAHIDPFMVLFLTVQQTGPKGWSLASTFEQCDWTLLPITDWTRFSPPGFFLWGFGLNIHTPANLHEHQTGRTSCFRNYTTYSKKQ